MNLLESIIETVKTKFPKEIDFPYLGNRTFFESDGYEEFGEEFRFFEREAPIFTWVCAVANESIYKNNTYCVQIFPIPNYSKEKDFHDIFSEDDLTVFIKDKKEIEFLMSCFLANNRMSFMNF